jgi:hypothetical protein
VPRQLLLQRREGIFGGSMPRACFQDFFRPGADKGISACLLRGGGLEEEAVLGGGFGGDLEVGGGGGEEVGIDLCVNWDEGRAGFGR